jgi:outer membrane protein W
MKKKIILSLLLLVSIKYNAQEKVENKFLISLHYIGNLRTENFVSDNYNGILGIDAKYILVNKKSFSLQGGLGLDYFKGRTSNNHLDFKNSLMFNPNIGIEFNANKTFKPFFNLGYSFFTAKYQIQQAYSPIYDPVVDPAFQTISNTVKYDYNSISINPGFRLYLNNQFYAQADYKYLPIKTNFNVHLIAIGAGIQF